MVRIAKRVVMFDGFDFISMLNWIWVNDSQQVEWKVTGLKADLIWAREDAMTQ